MNAKHKILIVDDDEDILDLLQYNLDTEGYSVKTLSTSSTALSVASSFIPDLLILDLMMPGINGIDVCKKIRQDDTLNDIYIFFLTAKSDPYYQHAVFSVGGDEFVDKNAGLKPLITKIATVLKEDFIIRKRIMELKIGSLELYRGVETVYREGNKVTLSRSEFEILFFLAQNSGKVISTQQLIHSLWGSKTFMDEKSVRMFISNIRRKLGQSVIEESRFNMFYFNPI